VRLALFILLLARLLILLLLAGLLAPTLLLTGLLVRILALLIIRILVLVRHSEPPLLTASNNARKARKLRFQTALAAFSGCGMPIAK
jgi:hypothetical protein